MTSAQSALDQLFDERWGGLRAAARSLGRVNEALVARETTAADLDAIVVAADQLADRLEQRDRRDKLADMQTFPRLAFLYGDAPEPPPVDDGGELEFDPFTFVGGALHPGSMGVRFFRDGDAVRATARLGHAHVGPPGRVHGGAVAAIIDETMGAVNRVLGHRAFTASLTVDYRAAAPIDVDVEFRAWSAGRDGRKITIACEGRGPDGVFVEATGLFVGPRDGVAVG